MRLTPFLFVHPFLLGQRGERKKKERKRKKEKKTNGPAELIVARTKKK